MTSDWPTRIGWTLFVVVLGTFVAGLHAINPFAVGLGYYVLYVVAHSQKYEEGMSDEEKLTHTEKIVIGDLRQRLGFVSLIALLYLGFNIYNNMEKAALRDDVISVCTSAEFQQPLWAKDLCVKVMDYVDPPENDDYDY